jgi:hypothetical protein
MKADKDLIYYHQLDALCYCPPRSNCRRCGGRGVAGVERGSNAWVLCRCVTKQFTPEIIRLLDARKKMRDRHQEQFYAGMLKVHEARLAWRPPPRLQLKWPARLIRFLAEIFTSVRPLPETIPT